MHLRILGMYYLLMSGAMLLHPSSVIVQHLLQAAVACHEPLDHPGKGRALQYLWHDQGSWLPWLDWTKVGGGFPRLMM